MRPSGTPIRQTNPPRLFNIGSLTYLTATMLTHRVHHQPGRYSAMTATHYDVLIIGSGFGGSVTALRLVEKGYKVGVLEAGKRYADEDFAKYSWHLKQFLWAPAVGCYGIQRSHLLRNVMILAGAGVGGGSLNYANTLYQAEEEYFRNKQWAHITDWKEELTPYYDQTRRMLGVVTNPTMTPAEKLKKQTAEELDVANTFRIETEGMIFDQKQG